MFVYKPSGSGFDSSCSPLKFRFRACFEQGVPWHSGNYRMWIHSETRTWHDKNIQSRRKHGNYENDPLFSFTCSALTVCNIHFLYLKRVIIHFHVIPPPFDPFWSVKYLNFGHSHRLRQPIILFYKVDTQRLLKIHIMFCSPKGAKTGISFWTIGISFWYQLLSWFE